MDGSLVQSVKLAAIAATGLSKDALHVHVGLVAYLGVAAVTRRRLDSLVPWSAAVLVALIGEAVDLRDDVLSLGYWRWGASVHDLVNTVFWPTALVLLFRSGRHAP